MLSGNEEVNANEVVLNVGSAVLAADEVAVGLGLGPTSSSNLKKDYWSQNKRED